MTDGDLPSESWYESGETTTQERLPDVRLGEQGQLVGDVGERESPRTEMERVDDWLAAYRRVFGGCERE